MSRMNVEILGTIIYIDLQTILKPPKTVVMNVYISGTIKARWLRFSI